MTGHVLLDTDVFSYPWHRIRRTEPFRVGVRHAIPLATNNRRDFEGIEGLQLVEASA